MPTPVTRKADVLARLVESEGRLRALGVSALALFGSFARDEARPDSDVDLLVDFAPGRKSFDGLDALVSFLEELLGRRVEVVTREALSPHLGPRILDEAEDVVRAA